MGRADGNAVQADAEEDDEPDGVDGGLGVWVYLGEEAGWFVLLVGFACRMRGGREHTKKRVGLHHEQKRRPFECLLAWRNSR